MKARSHLFLTSALTLALLPPALLPPKAAAGGCGDTPGVWHLHGESGQEFSPRIGEIGVWRPGPKAPPPAFGIPAEGNIDALSAAPGHQGLIADFERYEIEGKLYYAFVFAAGEGQDKLLGNLGGAAAVTAKIVEQAGLHFQLEDFEVFRADGSWRFDLLFHEGAAERFFESEVKGSDVPGKLGARHLKDFEIQSKGAQPTFALLLADGHEDQLFFPSLSAQEFHDKAHRPSEDETEYRLKDVEVWRSDLGETRFSALFEKAALADHLWVSPCGLTCPKKDDFALTTADIGSRIAALQAKKPTLRLVDLELPLDPEKTAPVLAGKNRKVATSGGRPKISRQDKPLLGSPPPDDTCTHAGVLHDAGTDGPP